MEDFGRFGKALYEEVESGGERRAERHAQSPSDQAHDHRFDEELSHDVAPLGAQRLAHSDLGRPFGDGHQHDVHDSDPSDEERDAGDSGKQRGEDERRGLHRLQGVLETEDLKIVFLIGAEIVAPAHDARDAAYRLFGRIFMKPLKGDLMNVVRADDAPHHRGIGR